MLYEFAGNHGTENRILHAKIKKVKDRQDGKSGIMKEIARDTGGGEDIYFCENSEQLIRNQ